MQKSRYITTTLPYVNASPHLGHALEFVQADTMARRWRLWGEDVFFNVGVDEHGQKIARKADEAGVDYQSYVDKYATEFDKLKGALDLSYDSFIRTSSEGHKLAVHEIWKRCNEAGDIYKKKYKGLYCVGCEAFKSESDLVNGQCPDHQVVPTEIEEENYFFRLSKYQNYLIEYLSKEGAVVPEFRRQEALNFVRQGLDDLSISREKSRMSWGINVPDDPDHVVYVWFDALTNYISCLGWPDDAEGKFDKFWAEGVTLQMAGKDQVRFQSIIWQAMLKSAGVKETDQIFYHGFINSGGHKMSKSLGNVIDPYALVKRYGTDATRYLLLRHVHPTDDTDLTWEKMDEWYTANLVNGLGNLTARVMKMAETYLDKPVEAMVYDNNQKEHWSRFEFQAVLDLTWHLIGDLDQYIQDTQPFKLVKEDRESAQKIITELVQRLRLIALSLQPFMPQTAEIISLAIKSNRKPENLFIRLEQ